MQSNMHMIACVNRRLAGSGVGVTREALFAHIREVFTLEESLRMAYIPLLLTRIAFRFTEDVCRQCVAHKLPHKKETRVIREAMNSYISSTLGDSVSIETLQTLEKKTELLFLKAKDDITTLWFSVNQELKRTYPELDSEYPFLTDLYCAVSLLYYVREFEFKSDEEVKRRTGLPFSSFNVKEPGNVMKALLDIAGVYAIKQTKTIELAACIISRKVDVIIQEMQYLYRF